MRKSSWGIVNWSCKKDGQGPAACCVLCWLKLRRLCSQIPPEARFSYEKYREGHMRSHKACAIGYGIESVVPFWKFIDSVSKLGPTKGLVGLGVASECILSHCTWWLGNWGTTSNTAWGWSTGPGPGRTKHNEERDHLTAASLLVL